MSLQLANKMLELNDSIQRDDTGTLVAGQWMGGNGGLISRETMAHSDEGRKIALKEIAEIKAMEGDEIG